MYLKGQLCPLKFIAYTENEVDTIKQHNVNVHLYADDMQVYACCYPHNSQHSSAHISLHSWFLDVVCVSSTASAVKSKQLQYFLQSTSNRPKSYSVAK